MGICNSGNYRVYPERYVEENKQNSMIFSYQDKIALLMTCDKDFQIVNVNYNVLSSLNYTKQEIIGNYIWSIMPFEDRKHHTPIFLSGKDNHKVIPVSILQEKLEALNSKIRIARVIRKDKTFINAFINVKYSDSHKEYYIRMVPLDITMNPHIPYQMNKYLNNNSKCVIETQNDVLCMKIGFVDEQKSIKIATSGDILTHLQTIYFLLNKDVFAEFYDYMYVQIPENLGIYILFNLKFMRQYSKFASMAYNIAVKSIKIINNYFKLKDIKLRISCALSYGNLSYGVLNNRSFQSFGFTKTICDSLLCKTTEDSFIMCEDTYELITEENTLTQLNVDLKESANMSDFIRCNIQYENNNSGENNLSANNVLMKFLRLQ